MSAGTAPLKTRQARLLPPRICVGIWRPGGLLLVTVPLGYNPHLDNAVATGELKFDEMVFLERTSRRNDWVCCDKDAALERSYGTPFRNANALLVGIDRR